MHLKIKVLNNHIRKFYEEPRKNHACDSGFDLFCDREVVPGLSTGYMLWLGVACAAYDDCGNNVPFMIVPRSSICKTSLRLANSIGIIDRSYRGELKAAVDALKLCDCAIKVGDRLFQIVSFDGSPITHELVDELDETERGAGGHGSTGK